MPGINVRVGYPMHRFFIEKTNREVTWYYYSSGRFRCKHRVDGPAVRHYSVFNTVSNQYWVNNFRMTYEDFLAYNERKRNERKGNH